jgi:hypothetical protein
MWRKAGIKRSEYAALIGVGGLITKTVLPIAGRLVSVVQPKKTVEGRPWKIDGRKSPADLNKAVSGPAWSTSEPEVSPALLMPTTWVCAEPGKSSAIKLFGRVSTNP